MNFVAVVGRPNVGKSTLINRIVGRREAIVEERPGVTRDRKEIVSSWRGQDFTLVDTGGWIAGGDQLDDKVSQQSERAISAADVVLFVVDVTVGVTEEDARVAALLLGRSHSVIVVANKVDDRIHEAGIWDLLSLGLGDPVPVSALHGRGAGDLLDRLVDLFPRDPADEDSSTDVTEDDKGGLLGVAIVGRPNVGKSTLFNRLIGEERSVVHDLPGTTRDSVDTVVETDEGPIRFIDTAGMRRKAKIDEDAEYYSLIRALRSVDTADVALLVIDSTIGVTHQDQRLAERVDSAGCPIILILNKWDQCDTNQREAVSDQVERRLHFVGGSPAIRMSALTGKNVAKLWPALSNSIENYRTRIPTRRVNDVIRRAQAAHPAPAGARVLYATQGATDPPTFTLFVNRELPRTWIRYIERRLQDDLDLGSTPVKIRIRRRSE